MSSIPFPPAAGLAERFTVLTRGLLRVVSQQAHRHQAHRHPAALPLLTVFCLWLHRLPQRFARLAARAAAGTLPHRPAAPRATPRPPRPPPGDPPAHPRQRLPGSRMWVLRVLQPEAYNAAAYANDLRDLMAHPDMLALLELAPQARRLLRPLCRLLTADAIPVLGLRLYRNRPPAKPRAAPAPTNTAAPTAAVAPPAPPTPYGQGPRDFDPDQYHRHPFLPGHLARRPSR